MAKRVRILTSNTTKGRPGGWGKVAAGQSGGGRLIQTAKSGVAKVKRVYRKNPADGIVANIGTVRDVNPVTKRNTVGYSTPKTVKSVLGKSKVDKHIGKRDTSPNRRVRRTNS